MRVRWRSPIRATGATPAFLKRARAGIAALLTVLTVVVLRPPAAHAAGPAPHYLMTAFTNSSQSNMYVYDSADATNYRLIRANAYTPPSGLIRDPSVSDASFFRRTGLAGAGTISLESVHFPGHYLRHRDGLLWLERDDGTAAFRNGASFILE